MSVSFITISIGLFLASGALSAFEVLSECTCNACPMHHSNAFHLIAMPAQCTIAMPPMHIAMPHHQCTMPAQCHQCTLQCLTTNAP